ncbi:bifunctional methylenetetrahydrofolate dehydrogenase/methenyltetrahydrofolate cyclohydrolase FolD [Flammeovirga kamogawensis]|uniref:Bifunctional protein FolD n=1 Tax=Flammeovirga kamogawensis TaxID=373891 RepID=A0ABX8GXI0_9BACT|nr:bifunctional methylenetetrahydrofolate dehydrogenase/methenyltetrahydrofolate cyclohydrolase FolD [Flammeovirga kamogawensis]MBB6460687.1 methylenetetrahydrofolate dehydrogenase (NADP+)/methenyltetrahydrofolate cyclohydrolase [Flammeovirga kamogawensis]QWG08042.1 bifunctional methylenetetrahydrofolate dehydrogenase/methenyltetrahydrofolate cyclohydrolase FolD [Flammeovirga kamogawensis]TRX69849.1 bifunctional methylenetetrahydrofolate dehydrogenase/methenyltetrahydrofolate cyclohydrolase FolD
MQLIDGKATSNAIKLEIAEEVRKLTAAGGKKPHLAAILVGEDGASRTYVNHKVKSCEQVGFKSTLCKFDADITEEALLQTIDELNNDDDIDGFIVQLPLPKHINETKVTEAIDPNKDVDGFHPTNLGKMMLGLPTFLPATPYGIIQLLDRYGIETSGKKCVIVGRSHIVGTPMSLLMSRNSKVGNCTVTLTHSRTKDLKKECLEADILIAALGKAEFVTADMVKEGAVIVDVGITRIEDASKKSGFTLKGDVKFDEVSEKASWITPVPGGVGPMTVVSLLMNTLESVKRKTVKETV